MLICISLCALFTLTPCSTLPASSDVDSDAGLKPKLDIISILNPPKEETYDEKDLENANDVQYDHLPHITIWTFPTERRVFVGDIEIFINSAEDAENSLEAIDPQNILVQHPHKNHLHKDLEIEEELPAFKVKTKRNQVEVILPEFKQSNNDSPNEKINYLSKLSTDTGNVREKRETTLINHKEIVPGTPIVRHRREWGIPEYLQWLLPNLGGTSESEPSTSKANDEDGITSNGKDTQDKLKEIFEDSLKLPPVHPDLLKVLTEQLKDQRRKRAIDSENIINLINSGSNEDDDEESNELYNDLFEILQSDKDTDNVLITIYYLRK